MMNSRSPPMDCPWSPSSPVSISLATSIASSPRRGRPDSAALARRAGALAGASDTSPPRSISPKSLLLGGASCGSAGAWSRSRNSSAGASPADEGADGSDAKLVGSKSRRSPDADGSATSKDVLSRPSSRPPVDTPPEFRSNSSDRVRPSRRAGSNAGVSRMSAMRSGAACAGKGTAGDTSGVRCGSTALGAGGKIMSTSPVSMMFSPCVARFASCARLAGA